MEQSRDAQDLKQRYPTVDFASILVFAHRMFHERKSVNCHSQMHQMCIDTEWYWCCEKKCECNCHKGSAVRPAAECPIQTPEDMLPSAPWKQGQQRPTASRKFDRSTVRH